MGGEGGGVRNMSDSLMLKIQCTAVVVNKFSFLKEMFGIAPGNELIQGIRAIEINVYWKM